MRARRRQRSEAAGQDRSGLPVDHREVCGSPDHSYVGVQNLANDQASTRRFSSSSRC